MWSSPAFLERSDPLLIQADSGCNEIGVVTKLASLSDEDFKIRSSQGFAS